jgi:AAA15 family ATPase/GTPase
MENAINTLHIQNFKSIKDVTMLPRRVNLIIGQPNVGKSNILEAMSLLGGMFFDKEGGRFMEGQIRYEDIRNLFYDNDLKLTIRVSWDSGGALLSKESSVYKNTNTVNVFYHNTESALGKTKQEFMEQINPLVSKCLVAREKPLSHHGLKKEVGNISLVDNVLSLDGTIVHDDRSVAFFASSAPVRKFTFTSVNNFSHSYNETYLRPPMGDNMIDVIQYNGSTLRKDIAHLFKPYGLNFAVRASDRRFEVQKNVDGYIYDYPYSSIADTLQRIIFYLAAIESNDDAVILLEEPEAHSYPVYVSMLGRRMVESRNNQFFVATHSPYLITEVLEQMLPDEQQAQELAIFVAYYEDYQTKVKQLSDEEVRAIRNDGLDVFYNMDRYIPRPVNG